MRLLKGNWGHIHLSWMNGRKTTGQIHNLGQLFVVFIVSSGSSSDSPSGGVIMHSVADGAATFNMTPI